MVMCDAACQCSYCTEEHEPLDVLRGKITRDEFHKYCLERMIQYKDSESQEKYQLWLEFLNE